LRFVRYLDAAEDDLNAIFDFVHVQSRSAQTALAFVESIIDRVSAIADQPFELGRDRIELGHGLRSLPFGKYVLFFRYTDNGLEVVRIIEGHRDLDAQFDAPGR